MESKDLHFEISNDTTHIWNTAAARVNFALYSPPSAIQ
jgi:hypothetical protein